LRADALAELGRWRDVEPGAARHHRQRARRRRAAEGRVRLEKLARAPAISGRCWRSSTIAGDRSRRSVCDARAPSCRRWSTGSAHAVERWVALRERLPAIRRRCARSNESTHASAGARSYLCARGADGLYDSVHERAACSARSPSPEPSSASARAPSSRWNGWLEFEPDETTWRSLADLYRIEGRFAALADECTRHVATARRKAAALWREVAGVYERELGDPGQAIKCWKAVLE